MNKHVMIDGAVVEDRWTLLDDAAELTPAPSLISLERLTSLPDMTARRDPLGVIIRAGSKVGEDVYALTPYLDHLQLIAIEFSAFRNGRGYSSARILREELGYTGELRAVGEILYDQLYFLHRCGFNAFELDGGLSADDFHRALNAFPDAYQPAGDANTGILWRRNRRN